MRLRSIRALIPAVIALAAATAVVPASASADAFGASTWQAFEIPIINVPVPGGTLFHDLKGPGTHVNSQLAWFAAPNICNWRIDFLYLDTNGRVYEVNRGPERHPCTGHGDRYITPNKDVRHGQACAELVSNGHALTRQCHNL